MQSSRTWVHDWQVPVSAAVSHACRRKWLEWPSTAVSHACRLTDGSNGLLQLYRLLARLRGWKIKTRPPFAVRLHSTNARPTSGYLNGYPHSNQTGNHFAKISAAYCARMRTALIKRFEAAERSDRRLRGAAAYFSCNTEDLHVKWCQIIPKKQKYSLYTKIQSIYKNTVLLYSE